jgi:PAS domain S-box-containing protein
VPQGNAEDPVTNRRLVALVNRSRALAGILADDGTPIYLSPGALELHTGRTSADGLVGKSPTELIHPDDLADLGTGFGTALEHPEQPVAVRYRTRHVDGSWHVIEGTYTNLLADPDIAGVVLDVLDVTDRAHAEDALRASEARNRRVIDSLAEAIILSSHGGQIVGCNPAAAELLGISQDELLEHTSQDLRFDLIRRDGSPIAPEERPATQTRKTGLPCHDVVMGVRRPDGECRWISANSVVIDAAPDGTPELVAVSLSDITALVESGAELEQNEQRFRTLIARSSDVVTVVGPDLLSPT